MLGACPPRKDFDGDVDGCLQPGMIGRVIYIYDQGHSIYWPSKSASGICRVAWGRHPDYPSSVHGGAGWNMREKWLLAPEAPAAIRLLLAGRE